MSNLAFNKWKSFEGIRQPPWSSSRPQPDRKAHLANDKEIPSENATAWLHTNAPVRDCREIIATSRAAPACGGLRFRSRRDKLNDSARKRRKATCQVPEVD